MRDDLLTDPSENSGGRTPSTPAGLACTTRSPPTSEPTGVRLHGPVPLGPLDADVLALQSLEQRHAGSRSWRPSAWPHLNSGACAYRSRMPEVVPHQPRRPAEFVRENAGDVMAEWIVRGRRLHPAQQLDGP